ncbi:MAG: SpoIIE family protein phosphatase [Bacteroidales bacterium]|nr:SpoIIE family protein phosphatase [Bacteroidales bacterium]
MSRFRNFHNYLRRNLYARLSLWIVLLSSLVFLAALNYLFFLARQTVRREAEQRAVQILDNTVLRVNGILEDVEIAADNLEWLVKRGIDAPDKMVDYAQEIVRNNSVLSSGSISFEPYFYPEKGLYYSIFAYRTYSGDVRWQQEGDEDYQYFYLDWYLFPKLLQKPCWTEPYDDVDESDDKDMDTGMIVSYCKPIFKEDSVLVGSISLDVSLKWLSETVTAVKPYPNSYCILVGRGGTYLVHPDPDKLFYQTLFTEGLVHADPDRYALGHSMQQREEGMQVINLDGQKSFVFYKPLSTTGWSVAIVCPDSDILGGFYRISRIVMYIILASMILIFFLSAWLTHRQLTPLSTLADAAENIASGNLDSTLPEIDRIDEIGVLNRSFRNMQSSLVSHIDQLTKATAARESLNRELQIASNIQMAMVPHVFPSREDVDVYAMMAPAREVGGDLYDFFIQDEKLYFCIGDVSGKGIPASLMMSVARAMFRILAKQGLSPAEIARQINDLASEDNEQMMFVTMFMASLDLQSGVLNYCNCGHNAPVLISGRGKKPHFLDCKPNMAIGIMGGFAFEGQTVANFRGKSLFVYTDGLNEAENAEHEQFGEDRMLFLLAEENFTNAQTTIETMHQAVTAHVNGAAQSDDLTMLCISLSA